jgi:hypothetical protein
MSNQMYLDIVTSQHRNKARFMAWLTATLEIGDDIYNLIGEIDTDFDIDSAVGDQLDTLGEIVGVGRFLNFQPSGSISPVLEDEDYRFVIKSKIAKNQWDGTIPGLYQIWDIVFPAIPIRIQDNQDMTYEVLFVSQSFTDLQQELISNGYIIPRPEGVLCTYDFNGTFSFRTAAIDSPYTPEEDDEAGFSDVTQVDGGYFGSVSTS